MKTYVIGGMVRSGTTLLSSLLSSATGGFDCGELNLLWRSLEDGRLCTCGNPVSDCPVWRPVSHCVLDSVPARSFGELAEIMSGGVRQRDLLRPVPLQPRQGAVEVRAALEDALRQHLGMDTLIDSSKLATATAIALAARACTRGIHLIRDPRAVAYSLSHPHTDPSAHGKPMDSFGSTTAGAMWLTTNLAMVRVGAMNPDRVSVVKYEDVAAQPDAVIKRLTGNNGNIVAFSARESHAIAGNPARFSIGQPVALDVRWETAAYRRQARIVWLLTGWMARRYGYRRRSS